MSWTKRQIISQAWEELGYAQYAFDLEPEQFESGLRRLDSLVGLWEGKGIYLGYNLPDGFSDAELDTVIDIPDESVSALWLNLALSLAPTVGKIPSQETKVNAKTAYKTLLQQTAYPAPRQLPAEMPSGAGNKTWRWNKDPFVDPPSDPIKVGRSGPLNLK